MHFLNPSLLYIRNLVSLCDPLATGCGDARDDGPERMEGGRDATSGCANLIGGQSKVSGKVRGVF